MPNNKCDICPGCKRHCTACCPRCKYGKKYFADKHPKEDTPKWAQNLCPEGPAFQMLNISKQAKKALRKEKITENALFEGLAPQDLQVFRDLLRTVEQNLANFK